MPNYAIHDGQKVVNVIVSDSLEVAEAATGMEAIETSGSPWIGWTFELEGWRPPSPYPSWSWNGSDWQPPIPMPTLGGYFYTWNEGSMNWDEEEIPSPYPSWIKDENNDWIAPIEYPQDGQNYIWNEELLSWEKIGEN